MHMGRKSQPSFASTLFVRSIWPKGLGSFGQVSRKGTSGVSPAKRCTFTRTVALVTGASRSEKFAGSRILCGACYDRPRRAAWSLTIRPSGRAYSAPLNSGVSHLNMSTRFIIEDREHAEWQSEHSSLEGAQAELRRLASMRWDQEPNIAPCKSWQTCRRNYEILQYDTSSKPWRLTTRHPGLEVSANGVVWASGAPNNGA